MLHSEVKRINTKRGEMMIKKNILYFLVLPFIINAQTVDFNWLVGKWKMDSDKAEVYEEWQKDGDRFMGEGYRIKNGNKIITEKLFIENFDGQWAYIAMPKGQTITLFALYDTHYGVYTFVNWEHDFPQRIIYTYDGKKTIHVSVEADNDGETKKFEFTLIKVE